MASKSIRMKDIAKDISVSRNVLVSAIDFDDFELNVIVQTIVLLRSCIFKVDELPVPRELFIRFDDITGRHGNRKELVERLNRLRQKDIRYTYGTCGRQSGLVITGLFSSVVVSKGGVKARVSPEAIPWLLYVGGGVGYARIEPEIFSHLRSVYHKRLYLLLNSKAYNGGTKFKAEIEMLREMMGVPPKVPLAIFRQRYLEDFRISLENHESIYSFNYDPIIESTIGAGRPKIVGYEISFSLKPELIKDSSMNDANYLCLTELQRLYRFLSSKHPDMMSLSEIHNCLIASNSCSTFLQAMSAYSDKTPEHRANIMAIILRDRYGIDIISPQKKAAK